MELQSVAWIFVVLFVGQLKVGNAICGKNQYRILKNNSISCLACNTCAHGQGLDPPCGTLLKHPPTQVDCFECKLGLTYSDEYGPSSCKKCSHCSSHEIITKNCTLESDTICSHTCERGFYFDNSSHNCQACSFCCGDGRDIQIAACKSPTKKCSFHDGDRCAPTKPATASTLITATPVDKNDPAKEQKNTGATVAIAIAGCIVSLAIVIILIYCLKKKRKNQRQNIQKANNIVVQENGDMHLLRCGLEEMNFELRLQDYIGPITSTKLLVHGGELLLEVFCENENDNCCFGQCEFKWKKDGIELKYEEQKMLKKEDMKIVDSGKYICHLHCPRHDKEKECNDMTVHVKPRQGEELKLLKDINLEKRQELEQLIKPKVADVGNWENIGAHYGMKPETLASLKDENDRAEKVFEYLFSAQPELTVFHFCEFLKTINQQNIVKKLLNDLTVTRKGADANAFLNDTRDSGIDFEDHCCLQVELPEPKMPGTISARRHIMMNAAYSDSSREGSLDELPTSKKMVERKKIYDNGSDAGVKSKRKRSFNRQESNQSNKSTGNMSLNSIKNAVSNASNAVSKKLTTRRQTSYFEHKRDDDTDDSEV